MARRVLDVGNCGYDHGQLREAIVKHFDVQLERAAGAEEAIGRLREGRYDLVLVNRLFAGGSGDGIGLIRQIKGDEALAATPVMLLSNYEEYQQEAIQAGAEPGFGKSQLGSEEVRQRLARFLSG